MQTKVQSLLPGYSCLRAHPGRVALTRSESQPNQVLDHFWEIQVTRFRSLSKKIKQTRDSRIHECTRLIKRLATEVERPIRLQYRQSLAPSHAWLSGASH